MVLINRSYSIIVPIPYLISIPNPVPNPVPITILYHFLRVLKGTILDIQSDAQSMVSKKYP
mgnify:CR=1 FL=1